MGITERLIDYMEKEGISPETVAEQANISLAKLRRESKRSLNASELCQLCSVLQVQPEDFYEKKMPPYSAKSANEQDGYLE